MSDITELIGKARAGDAQASEHLFASLYGELRRLAAAQLRGDNIMRSTSLVHETWLKLANHGSLDVTDLQARDRRRTVRVTNVRNDRAFRIF